MNKATAATVANDLTTAGYLATVRKEGGNYKVTATTDDGTAVAASAISAFASARGVSGQCYSAEFV